MSPERSAVDLVLEAIDGRMIGDPPRPLVIGICGAQGSGKSTLCGEVAARLRVAGHRVAVLSIDDLYLTLSAREHLAREVHPLLRTRGVPGTHDVGLGLAVLDRLAGAGETLIPRFDKARDDRRPAGEWERFSGSADVILFEGWCVGAQPESEAALAAPINAIEAEEDRDGRWRHAANSALAGPYQSLFARIDLLILLAAPGFDIVRHWRTEQEQRLRAASSRAGTHIMADAEIERFVSFYERITRHVLAEMPDRADLVIGLADDRSVANVARRAPA